ncbi:MAG TPA: endonuclease domain-containing protein [Candidatus Binataceae bacterium]|nr:endonuclease domain-containing protein [Candidatus Binataceae bacterium]
MILLSGRQRWHATERDSSDISVPNAEQKLWRHLRNSQVKGMKFRRQRPIGPYVADFVCLEARLVVEVDGGDHDTKERRRADAARSYYLERHGYRVLRFWNNEIMSNIEGALERISEGISRNR